MFFKHLCQRKHVILNTLLTNYKKKLECMLLLMGIQIFMEFDINIFASLKKKINKFFICDCEFIITKNLLLEFLKYHLN